VEVKQIVSHLQESSHDSTHCELSAQVTGTCNNYIALSMSISFIV